MQRHVVNYFEAHGISPSDFVACEYCGSKSCEVHHIVPRSKFGKKTKHLQDEPGNLIALCRSCHEKAHSNKEFNEHLKTLKI